MNFSEIMAENSELIESLRKMGLNQYEAKAYCALSLFGDMTAGDLSDKGKIARPRTYDVLTKLQEKGFAAIQNGRPIKYSALPIAEAVKTLHKVRETEFLEEMQNIEIIAKEVGGKIKPSTSVEPLGDENVWTLKGRESIYSKIGSMITGAKKHIVFSSQPEGILRKFKMHVKELGKARERGVKIHVYSMIEQNEALKIAHCVNQKNIPTRMVLADDQALLFLTDAKAKADDEIGVWMHSPHLVETLKQGLNLEK